MEQGSTGVIESDPSSCHSLVLVVVLQDDIVN
jgi:hypothetical protein